MTVLVVGDVLTDVVVQPQDADRPDSDTAATITHRMGGAAAVTAAWLAHLDTPVRLCGRVGDDLRGRALHTVLAANGVEPALSSAQDRATGTVVATVRGQRRDMVTDRGAAGTLAAADVDAAWALGQPSHLHLSGYVLLSEATRGAGLRALELARGAEVPISVDPSSVAPLAEVGPHAFLSWLPPGTLVTPNLAEARLLTGVAEAADAALALAAMTGTAMVTCDADGLVWSDGADVREAEAVEPPEAELDPVGAGDACTAGLLSARHRGLDIARQLAVAVQTGAAAVGGMRPDALQPT